jgi:hypothetical protein
MRLVADARRRLCAAIEPPDRDAELRRLPGDIGLDAGTREDDDPDRHDSSIASLRLNSTALRCFFQSGLKAICRNITHNKTYATCAQFAHATLAFLRDIEGFSGCDVNGV